MSQTSVANFLKVKKQKQYKRLRNLLHFLFYSFTSNCFSSAFIFLLKSLHSYSRLLFSCNLFLLALSTSPFVTAKRCFKLLDSLSVNFFCLSALLQVRTCWSRCVWLEIRDTFSVFSVFRNYKHKHKHKHPNHIKQNWNKNKCKST